MSARDVTAGPSHALARLRTGLLLIILSWFPFAQIVISVATHRGNLTSEGSAQEVRLAIWGVQFLVGFVGLWLAGAVAVAAAEGRRLAATPVEPLEPPQERRTAQRLRLCAAPVRRRSRATTGRGQRHRLAGQHEALGHLVVARARSCGAISTSPSTSLARQVPQTPPLQAYGASARTASVASSTDPSAGMGNVVVRPSRRTVTSLAASAVPAPAELGRPRRLALHVEQLEVHRGGGTPRVDQ